MSSMIDITYCTNSDCGITSCNRHMFWADKTNPNSFADYEDCPYWGLKEEEQDTAAAYCKGYMDGRASVQASCPYCHEDSDGYVKPLEKNCHAAIHFSAIDDWHISIKANGWRGQAKINYCPMCGRRLKNDE